MSACHFITPHISHHLPFSYSREPVFHPGFSSCLAGSPYSSPPPPLVLWYCASFFIVTYCCLLPFSIEHLNWSLRRWRDKGREWWNDDNENPFDFEGTHLCIIWGGGWRGRIKDIQFNPMYYDHNNKGHSYHQKNDEKKWYRTRTKFASSFLYMNPTFLTLSIILFFFLFWWNESKTCS